jgi:hypothetical protein
LVKYVKTYNIKIVVFDLDDTLMEGTFEPQGKRFAARPSMVELRAKLLDVRDDGYQADSGLGFGLGGVPGQVLGMESEDRLVRFAVATGNANIVELAEDGAFKAFVGDRLVAVVGAPPAPSDYYEAGETYPNRRDLDVYFQEYKSDDESLDAMRTKLPHLQEIHRVSGVPANKILIIDDRFVGWSGIGNPTPAEGLFAEGFHVASYNPDDGKFYTIQKRTYRAQWGGLGKMSVRELREAAGAMRVPGRSTMRRAELVAALKKARGARGARGRAATCRQGRSREQSSLPRGGGPLA